MNETDPSLSPSSSSSPSSSFPPSSLLLPLIIALLFSLILILLLLLYRYIKRRKHSSPPPPPKRKINEKTRSIYDDRFGILEEDCRPLPDKSMIKKFLEENRVISEEGRRKGEEGGGRREEGGGRREGGRREEGGGGKRREEGGGRDYFNYVSAKNVFNIEGEESELDGGVEISLEGGEGEQLSSQENDDRDKNALE